MSFMNVGPQTMLKDGATLVDAPQIQNIGACREIAKITKSSLGPYGLCKMIVNHLNKIFVTHDADTILRELEVEHPAAKLLVQAANAMQEEVGDGTNLVVTLAGEFISRAEELFRMGLHPSVMIEGYKKAGKKALELIQTMEAGRVEDCLHREKVLPCIRTAIASKQYGYEDLLAGLVADACINACSSDVKSFNVDNVRVVKLDGESVLSSHLVRGFVVGRDTESVCKHLKDAKVAVYNCAIDIPSLETKGTALIENAEDLIQYSKKEEEVMKKIITNIAATGANTIVTNSTFGDLALHFINSLGMMAVRVPSKWEIRRLCSAVGARVLNRIDTPTIEEMGTCDHIDIKDVGGRIITVFSQEKDDSKLSTIVVRGATQNVLDDVERAIDDGINVFKALTKDNRFVAGAGAFEMDIRNELFKFGSVLSDIDQYAVKSYAESFEVIARTLAEVSGYNGTEMVTELIAEHTNGKKYQGVNVDDGKTLNAVEHKILDAFYTKMWAIQIATDIAITVLSINNIIVSKQAGGPKNRPDQPRDA